MSLILKGGGKKIGFAILTNDFRTRSFSLQKIGTKARFDSSHDFTKKKNFFWCQRTFSTDYDDLFFPLIFHRCSEVPVINQIEFNPYCVDQDILEVCQENKILVQAYAPLGSGTRQEQNKKAGEWLVFF